MQRLEVSGALRPLYVSLGVKGLNCVLDAGGLLMSYPSCFNSWNEPASIL